MTDPPADKPASPSRASHQAVSRRSPQGQGGPLLEKFRRLWPAVRKTWAWFRAQPIRSVSAACGHIQEQLRILLRQTLGAGFFKGMGLAFLVGGVVWLLTTAHPVALAITLIGLALWLANGRLDSPTGRD